MGGRPCTDVCQPKMELFIRQMANSRQRLFVALIRGLVCRAIGRIVAGGPNSVPHSDATSIVNLAHPFPILPCNARPGISFIRFFVKSRPRDALTDPGMERPARTRKLARLAGRPAAIPKKVSAMPTSLSQQVQCLVTTTSTWTDVVISQLHMAR